MNMEKIAMAQEIFAINNPDILQIIKEQIHRIKDAYSTKSKEATLEMIGQGMREMHASKGRDVRDFLSEL